MDENASAVQLRIPRSSMTRSSSYPWRGCSSNSPSTVSSASVSVGSTAIF
ncbi:hypothetical protein ACFQZ4_03720 [Catellatospora coxensis]